VTIEPQGARDAGAQWRRSGTTTWHDSDYTEGAVSAGSITIEFKSISGWTRPPNQAAWITDGGTTFAAVKYVRTSATSAWKLISTSQPMWRTEHAMAYDSARSEIIIFGGKDYNSSALLDDTWIWNGNDWIQKSPNNSPPKRFRHAMTYDSARGVVVLFGGLDESSIVFGDTWEWDGSSWTQVSTSGPSPRNNHAMVYDSGRGMIVLFGGLGGSGDTWEWNGSSWTQVSTSGPSSRWEHAMAYDSARRVVVLFGGWNSSNLGDTWEWDGNNWNQVSNSGPRARSEHAIAYDSARGKVVLFSGTYYVGGGLWSSDKET